MERMPERLECVICISKVLLWVVQNDPVELSFSGGHRADGGLGAAEDGVGKRQRFPRVSLLSREHGNGCAIP